MGRTLNAVIEFAENNYAAYIKEVDGIIGIGETIEEVKKSLQESIEYCIQDCKEDGVEVPEALAGEYEIKYAYDMQTFLKVYSGILGKAGLERLTGINQKQLFHYESGLAKPRANTTKKIAESLHKFADELAQVEFA